MTSKTTSKMAAKAARKNAVKQSRKQHSARKPNRINRQRRLQKQLQALLLERHSRRCIICHHPEREAIEEEFVHWRAPWKLAQDYKLGDYRTIYRHARAAGLLPQRRERLHSALDAFVESVDDVTFTGDTILRAMRAYSCIDAQGRWTEIPTQVQISTFHDDGPPPPPPSPRGPNPRVSNDVPGVRANLPSSLGSRILDVIPDVIDQNSNPASRTAATATARSLSSKSTSRSDTTACAASPAQALPREIVRGQNPNDRSPSDRAASAASLAQALNLTEDEYNDPAVLKKLVASLTASSKSMSRSDTTACAASPAQAFDATEDDYADPEDDDCDADNEDDSENGAEPEDDPDDDRDEDKNPKNKSHVDSLEETTACAAPTQNAARHVAQPNRNPLQQQTGRAATATACAVSPAQALPREIVRGQNPNDRSPSDRTDCAAVPAQPAAPHKPKPDADGFVWHPRPGYPNQEISEPNAEGRVAYKIHMTTAAPPRETDAQRAAELIYRSVIKKYGNQ